MENFLLELFVRGLVLCLLAAMTLALFRRAAAAYRHLICVLALCSLLALPWAQRLLPSLRLLPPQTAVAPKRIAALPQPSGQLTDLSPKSDLPAFQDASPETDKGRKPPDLLPTKSDSAAHRRTALLSSLRQQRSRQALTVVLAIWGIGAATLLIRLLVALVRLRRLEAQSHPTLLDGVPILVSERISTPLTWGIRSPIILLPTALLSGDPAVCATAIRHEQAHIARWDWTWNLLAELVCALCWFQPGAWWLRSRMRLESERACDDRVLLSGVAGPDYAAHLLEIVRSVSTTEVAPAMAQSGTMEERMRHILDGAKPRHTQTGWLTVSAIFATALLSLAALRVSARSAEAKLPTPKGAAIMTQNGSVSQQPSSSSRVEKPGATEKANVPQVIGSPAATPEDIIPGMKLENVTWGKAVDGLEPGLLLTLPAFPRDHPVPSNTHVNYRVLVRNTTGQERTFVLRCLNTDNWNIPYLIPDANIAEALSGRSIPGKFRATATSSPFDGLFPAFLIKLAPGESVVVPGELGLYLGDADKQSFPRMETVKAGMNWIVQPIAIFRPTAAERKDAESSSAIHTITIDHNGKTGTKSLPQVPARSGGNLLYARVRIEVTTPHATVVSIAASHVSSRPTQKPGSTGSAAEPQGSAPPPATAAAATAQHKDAATPQIPGPIAWGPGRDIQAGLALWNRYGNPDQHTGLYIFNVYLRNRTKQTLTVDCPSFSGLSVPGDDTDYTTLIQSPMIYCSPQIRDSAGKPVDVSFRPGEEHTQYTLKPGQVVLVSHWMLRTMKQEAKGANTAKYTQVVFVAPGQFHLQCSVNVSWGNKAGQRPMLSTGDVPFEVTGDDVGR